MGQTPCFPGPCWAQLHQNHLPFLLPKTGGQTAAAAILFLLPPQAASSALSLWSNARHRGETQPRQQMLRTLLEAPVPSVLPAPQHSQLSQLPRRKILTLQFSGGRKREKTEARTPVMALRGWTCQFSPFRSTCSNSRGGFGNWSIV